MPLSSWIITSIAALDGGEEWVQQSMVDGRVYLVRDLCCDTTCDVAFCFNSFIVFMLPVTQLRPAKQRASSLQTIQERAVPVI